MPIPFACPFCEFETLVDDKFAGQSGRCAGCGKQITVPYIVGSNGIASDEVVVGIPYKKRSPLTLAFVMIGGLLAGLGALGITVSLFLPAVGAVRAVSHQHGCTRNLQRIATALAAYETEYGTLPPAYIPDAAGRPLHSWRVLILPFLEGQQGLYDAYDFSQPWDSTDNKLLQARMPAVFSCPADPDTRALGESNYMVVVGPRTLFPGAQARRTTDITDDQATTIMLVETPVQGNSWLEPKDLRIEAMQYVVNGDFGTEIASYHEGGAHVLTADGSVHFVDDTLPPDYIQGMLTISGGEPIAPEVIDEPVQAWQ